MDNLEMVKKEIDKNKILGIGTHCIAYSCQIDKKEVCVKKNLKEKLDKKNIDHYHEINILKKLSSPYIINLLTYFEDTEYIYQVLEKGDFDLFSKLGQMDEKQILLWIKEIAKGLLYLHSQNIMHRDIKAENIMVKNGGIKIIDFGYACYFKEGEIFKEMLGTPFYIAPEMIKESYDHKIDIWALGILYYDLINGSPPFYIEREGNNFSKILNLILDFDIVFNSEFSLNSRKNILKILTYLPENRASLLEIIDF